MLVEGIAEAADIPADEIRRTLMLASDPAPVAAAALGEGRAGLARFRLESMAPRRPMLAQPAGMPLRFARVKRFRKDKMPAEADTIDTVRKLFVAQTGAAS